MKARIIVILVFALAVSASLAKAQTMDDRVQALMEEYDVPGLSLAVVTPESTMFGSWGRADSAGTVPITADTPFRIASVSKVFVAAAALIEANRGAIRLDTDVSDLVPMKGPFSGPIRLHDLLTHSAGFDERLIGYAARSSDEMRPLRSYLEARMPARGWPAGEQIGYSNHGFALAALTLEDAANTSFSEIARKDLFDPLGMAATAFLTHGQEIPERSATPLSCTGGVCQTLPHIFSNAYPAGLAFSTGRDMSRFIAALLTAEEDESPLAGLMPTRFANDDRIPGMSYGFFHQAHGGRTFLSHAGSVPGYWALLLVSPEAKFGFFFATNGGSSRFGEKMRDLVLEAYFERNLASAEQPTHPGRERNEIKEHASNRTGAYELTRYSHNTIERFPELFQNTIQLAARGDTLVVYAGGSSNAYLPVEEGLYQSLDGTARLAFGERRRKTRLFRSSVVYGSAIPAAYEKLSWYQAPGFLNEYISWLLAAPLLLLFVFWPAGIGMGAIVRRIRGTSSRSVDAASVGAWFAAAATASLFAVFGLLFVARSVRLFESGEIAFGLPAALAALTWIPPAHAVLTVILCVLIVALYRRDGWGFVRRLFYLVVAGFALLQVAFFLSWNYLPVVW